MRFQFNAKYFCAFIIILLLEAIIAVYINDRFIRPYLGDILVVVLIHCFIRAFMQTKTKLLPVYIFIFAVIVELGQYLGMAELLGLSDHRAMRIILGSTFDTKDIACYFIGCLFLYLYETKKKAHKKGGLKI